jgi:hypothetical protein
MDAFSIDQNPLVLNKAEQAVFRFGQLRAAPSSDGHDWNIYSIRIEIDTIKLGSSTINTYLKLLS